MLRKGLYHIPARIRFSAFRNTTDTPDQDDQCDRTWEGLNSLYVRLAPASCASDNKIQEINILGGGDKYFLTGMLVREQISDTPKTGMTQNSTLPPKKKQKTERLKNHTQKNGFR